MAKREAILRRRHPLSHGINCRRGFVAEAIRDLVFADSRYLAVFYPTIEKLVADPSLAVRACVASRYTPSRGMTPLALRWSSTLFNTDDRLLATKYVQELIHRGVREHLQHFAPLVQRMLHSDCDEVKKTGGTMACLARRYDFDADNLSEAALAGDEHCRLGACIVAKSNVLHADCRARGAKRR